MHHFRAAAFALCVGLVASVGAVSSIKDYATVPAELAHDLKPRHESVCAASTVTVTVETIPSWCQMTTMTGTLPVPVSTVEGHVPTEGVPAAETVPASEAHIVPPVDTATVPTSGPGVSVPTSVVESVATTIGSVSSATVTAISSGMTRTSTRVLSSVTVTGTNTETQTAQTSAPPATGGSSKPAKIMVTVGMLVACAMANFIFVTLA